MLSKAVLVLIQRLNFTRRETFKVPSFGMEANYWLHAPSPIPPSAYSLAG